MLSVNKKNTCRDALNNLVYLNEKDKHLLIYKESKMEFAYAQIREIIPNREIKGAEGIIVNHFIFNNDVKSFFQYAGIIYPIDFIGETKVMHFTSALIEYYRKLRGSKCEK